MYVHLSWTEGGPEQHGDGYKIYRKKPGDDSFTLLYMNNDINATTYDDYDLPVEGTYYYRVVEWKDEFESDPAEAAVTIGAAGGSSSVATPTNLVDTVVVVI